MWLAVGLFSTLLLAPQAQAQIIEIPECGIDLPLDDPYCRFLCTLDPSEPWCLVATPTPTPLPQAEPVVLFIPGLQGSRLYSDESGSEKKLWEPTVSGDVAKLFLNDQGESVTSDIYTRDIIDEAFGHNIYKTFAQFMDELVSDGTLTAWRAVPYDWRFDVDDEVSNMTQALAALLDVSSTSPVTIIAHSNGGLIAKELITELERQKTAGESDLIDSLDRLILVAVPQLGTPKTIPGVLHGFGLDFAKGALLNSAVGRALAQYMPSAFTLLPSAGYFEEVLDPVVEFDPSVDRFAPWRTLYGDAINSQSELRSFLTGGNGAWDQPNANDIVSPAVLQDHFLAAAAEDQAEWAAWQAPAGIDVIQVAGWGLDTVKTVKYRAKRVFSCGDLSPTFCKDGYKLDSEPVFTVEGDKTVVNPSALAEGGSKFYLNLITHNKELFRFRRNREHASILEAEPLQEFVNNILTGVSSLPAHVSDSEPPVDEEDKRLRVSVHSPVSILVCGETPGDDGQPLCAGIESIPGSDIRKKIEDLPNSYYMEFGEGKYVGFDADEPHTITFEGTGLGTFDLTIEEVSGDTTSATLNYEDVPVIEGATAELSLQTIGDAAPLKIDMDSNGTFETVVNSGEQLTPSQLIDSLSIMISSLNLKHGDQNSIQSHLRNAQKKVNDKKDKNMKSVGSQLKEVEKKITHAVGRSVSQDEATAVVEVLNLISVRLGI